jgi:hypothetical protein
MVCRATPRAADSCLDTDLGPAYAHLLGLYLGDGNLSVGRRGVWRLRITLDVRYPDIIAGAQRSAATVAGHRSGLVQRSGCVDVSNYWKYWPCAFPQHGSGPKHMRPIRLEGWQMDLIRAEPRAFLAGLIESDGTRCMNRVRGYVYPRYFFTNMSSDIRQLFVWACSLVGVDCRADGPRNISVARRESVAILDGFVGPKR